MSIIALVLTPIRPSLHLLRGRLIRVVLGAVVVGAGGAGRVAAGRLDALRVAPGKQKGGRKVAVLEIFAS